MSGIDLINQQERPIQAQEKSENKQPFQLVQLPSGGRFYSKDSPLRKGTVQLKYPTAAQEDILTSQTLINKGIVLDKFLEALFIDKEIKLDQLLINDKQALLIYARVLAYGNDYSVIARCPICKKQQQLKVDLEKIEKKQIDYSQFKFNGSEFELALPESKSIITVKLVDQKTTDLIQQQLKGMKKLKAQVTPQLTTRLSNIITSVDGDRSMKSIRQFVSKLRAKDSLEIRKFINKITPGLDLRFDFNCESCGAFDKVRFDIQPSFFWPSAQS